MITGIITLVATWFLKPTTPSELSLPSNPTLQSFRADINPGGDLSLPPLPGIALSPDGQWLAYQVGTRAVGGNRIYVTPFEGQFKRIPVSSASGAWPYWHPEKKLIYYVRGNGIMEVEYDITLDQFERKSENLLFEGKEGVILQDFVMDPEGERFLVRRLNTIGDNKTKSDHLTLITGLHTLLEQKLGSDSN